MRREICHGTSTARAQRNCVSVVWRPVGLTGEKERVLWACYLLCGVLVLLGKPPDVWGRFLGNNSYGGGDMHGRRQISVPISGRREEEAP